LRARCLLPGQSTTTSAARYPLGVSCARVYSAAKSLGRLSLACPDAILGLKKLPIATWQWQAQELRTHCRALRVIHGGGLKTPIRSPQIRRSGAGPLPTPLPSLACRCRCRVACACAQCFDPRLFFDELPPPPQPRRMLPAGALVLCACMCLSPIAELGRLSKITAFNLNLNYSK
jgi:hypothetical protein